MVKSIVALNSNSAEGRLHLATTRLLNNIAMTLLESFRTRVAVS